MKQNVFGLSQCEFDLSTLRQVVDAASGINLSTQEKDASEAFVCLSMFDDNILSHFNLGFIILCPWEDLHHLFTFTPGVKFTVQEAKKHKNMFVTLATGSVFTWSYFCKMFFEEIEMRHISNQIQNHLEHAGFITVFKGWSKISEKDGTWSLRSQH
jgi:hypothetical protein